MKTRILLVLFAAMLPLVAQPQFGGARPANVGPGGPGKGFGGPGGNRVDYLAGYLTLTDSQKTAAKAIFDAAASEATAARGAAASAQDALQAGIKNGTSDNQIDTLAAAVGAAQAKQTAIQAKAEVKFRALLTADQKTKLDTAPGGRGPRP